MSNESTPQQQQQLLQSDGGATLSDTAGAICANDTDARFSDGPVVAISETEPKPVPPMEAIKPTRIIKNMFILDASKLKDLGIQSTLFSAMSKMNASKCAQCSLSVNIFLHVCTTDCASS